MALERSWKADMLDVSGGRLQAGRLVIGFCAPLQLFDEARQRSIAVPARKPTLHIRMGSMSRGVDCKRQQQVVVWRVG